VAARPRHRLIAVALLGLAAVIALLLLWRGGEGAGAPPPPLLRYGELRVGVDPSYPPFAAVNAEGYYGLEVDIAREIAARLDAPVRFVPLGFDGLYDALRADQADMVIAALLPDMSRLGQVMYTLPYFDAGLVLVSPAESGIEDMGNLPGQALAYEFGSLAESETRLWLRRVLPFETRPYELPTYALDAVRLGEADAALVDAITARLYRREHPAWAHEQNYVRSAHYSIAVRLDQGRVWAAVNTAMESMIEDGTLDALLAKWL
jgi:polar amino acid transport system substrate-binding protein